MKKFIVIAAAMLLTVSAFAQDGRSIYNKYSDGKGVTSVYVSPSMFKLMRRIPDIDLGNGDVNLSPIIKSLDGLYIINAENSKIGADLKADVDKLVKKGSYELLMEAKDDGDKVEIYSVGNDKIITSFVLLALEPDESTFICFSGQIPREELEKAIAGAAGMMD
ncbi:MAG: DUF4252 domain-containing protein [Bacteroidales bacterium]|nr:DUF4252 domain-containing protein [Bacteroidales bacterium]